MTVLFVLAFGIPFLDKAFGDKLPFLSNWPTTSINASIRRILGFKSFGGDTSFNNPQTGKQVAVNMLWAFSIFLALLAIAGARTLLGRPVSDTLANLLGTAFMGATALAAFQFMALRLRTRCNLRSVLLTIAIYAPIIMVVLGVFLVWGEIFDVAPFRISRSIVLFTSCASIILTALVSLLHNLRKSDAPAPAFTASMKYQYTEFAASLASLVAVAILFLLSS